MMDLTDLSVFASEHRFALVSLGVGGVVFGLGVLLPLAAVWSAVSGGLFSLLLYRFLNSGD